MIKVALIFYSGNTIYFTEQYQPGVKQPKVNLNPFFQIDDYIESKRKQVSPKMLAIYRNMKDTLQAFETFRGKSITFESFDFNFYEEFVDYMMYEHIQRRRKEVVKGLEPALLAKLSSYYGFSSVIGCEKRGSLLLIWRTLKY